MHCEKQKDGTLLKRELKRILLDEDESEEKKIVSTLDEEKQY